MIAYAVVTSVNAPTKGVIELERRFNSRLIVVGDSKTPDNWECGKADFLSLVDQSKLQIPYVDLAPVKHYARKNIGYLQAMRKGATVIYDTDDDNIPNQVWMYRHQTLPWASIVNKAGWCNVYKLFSDESIWPRGLALESVTTAVDNVSSVESEKCPIQQGTADGNPDVDAIWRLTQSRSFTFQKPGSVVLAEGVWCPINSQSTWWWPEAFPLMYLPAHATFRMTDIWRGFVAQRCLWAMGYRVAHHSPAEVFQERNPHNLLKDFADEIPGYLNNARIADILDRLTLDSNPECVYTNVMACYTALVDAGLLPHRELRELEVWLRSVRNILVR